MSPNQSPVQRTPRTGDIVLYYHFDAGRLHPLAALVSHVERAGDPRSALFLTVFRPGRTPEPRNYATPFAEEPANGYWGWREGD